MSRRTTGPKPAGEAGNKAALHKKEHNTGGAALLTLLRALLLSVVVSIRGHASSRICMTPCLPNCTAPLSPAVPSPLVALRIRRVAIALQTRSSACYRAAALIQHFLLQPEAHKAAMHARSLQRRS